MSEVNIFLLLLGCFGVTYTIKDSYVFKIPREWLILKFPILQKLFSCDFCAGFYSGIIWDILLFDYLNFPTLLTLPFSSMAVSGLLGLLADRLELG